MSVLPSGGASRQELRWAALGFLLLALSAIPKCLVGQVYMPGQYLNQYYPWRHDVAPQPSGFVEVGNPVLLDGAQVYMPHNIFLHTWLRRGCLPLWDPTTLCGRPLLAVGQPQELYPPRLLLNLLLPPEPAHNLFILLHLWCCGWFAYAWLRHLVVHPAAAALGAVAWTLNGFLVAGLEFECMLAPACLVPACLWAIERYALRPSRRSFALLSLAVAGLFLTGLFQYIFYCLLFLTVYAWLRQRTVVALGAMALAAIMAAAQLLPTAELISNVEKTHYASLADCFAQNRFFPENLLTLLIPQFLGIPTRYLYLSRFASPVENPLELGCHVGMVATLCALLAVACHPLRRLVIGLGSLATFTLLCAMGTPVYWVLFVVPGVNAMTPTRILYILPFCLATLAALGLDHLVTASLRRSTLLAVVPAVCLGLVALVIYGVQTGAGPIPGLFAYYRDHGVLTRYAGSYTVGPFLPYVVGSLLDFYRWSNPALWGPCLAGLVFAAVAGRRFGHGIAVGLCALELLSFCWQWNPSVPLGSTYRPFPALDLLPDSPRTVGVLHPTPPNLMMAYAIRDAAGYESLSPARYRRLFAQWNGGAMYDQASILVNLTPAFKPLANLLGIARYYCDPLLPSSRFPDPCIYRDELAVYQNPTANKRGWLVGHWRVLSDADMLERLTAPSFRPDQEALLEAPVAEPPGTTPAGSPGTARVDEESPDRVDISCEAAGNCLLLMSDTWYPGWEAQVDGQPAPLLRADYCFRAVPLAPGHHQVQMRYRPLSFRLGLALSGAALLLSLGLLWGRTQG